MRSLGLILILLTTMSLSANAANYGTAGCGLGASVWKDQPGKIQILAATVNNLVSPQTFAITSGTSNCVEDTKMASTMFIKVNEQALKKDISRGTGESLAGLSKILKCSNSELLGTELQKNYSQIFSAADLTAEKIQESINSTIHSNQNLAHDCVAAI